MPRTSTSRSSQADRPPGYLSVQEAAERIGIHPDHLLRLIRQAKRGKRAPILTPFSRPSWRARRKFWFLEADVMRVARERQTLHS